jgi:DNA-binding transcriptional ArsR family regulator
MSTFIPKRNIYIPKDIKMYMIAQKCSLWNVAEIFFKEPTRVHYVKEISRKIALAPTSVTNHLKTLYEMNLIVKARGDIYSGFKASRENSEFIFEKKIANLILLKTSGLIEKLAEKYPSRIIAYGSFDKGEDIETSDIDLFIDSKKFSVNLENFEKDLNRKVHIMFREEVDKSLMSSINNGTILFGEK